MSIRSAPSAPDRHSDHPVRPRGAVGGQARDRVHRAGVVRRCDRSRPGCAGPRTAVRRRADRGVAGRSVCRRRHDGSAVRPRRRLDARGRRSSASLTIRCRFIDALDRPFRDRASAHHSRRRDGGRRAGGAGLRHRAAVVRPVRDDRPRRVDRRGVGTLHHRTGQHPRRADLRVGAREHASTTSSTCPPPSAFPTRPSETAPTSPRSTSSPNEARSSPIRATGSLSPVRPTAPPRRSCVHRNPLLGSASTPTTTAETDIGAQAARRADGTLRRHCRSRGCGSWT